MIEKKALVSAIIPSFNHGRLVSDAIESVIQQTYPNLEIILVDDGSTDGTREIVKKYESRIKYVYQENMGLSAARNRGIEEAKGKLIAFLDADDVWLPDKIEKQTRVLFESDSIGTVSCGGHIVDENGNILKTVIKKNYCSRDKLLNDLLMKNVVFGGGSNALIKKECFDKVGMFDENLKSAEDWDMWVRISECYDIKFVESPLVKIRAITNSMSSTSNAEKMLHNEMIVLKKIFSNRTHNKSIFTKSKTYSLHYRRASWAFFTAGNMKKAREYILKSARTNPLYFFTDKECLVLAALIFPGKRVLSIWKNKWA